MLTSYIELNCDVLHAATGNRYVYNYDIRLVKLCQIAFFSNYKLTTRSGKHVENNDHAHIVSLMYKLITSTGDLMICLLVSTVVVIEDDVSWLITKLRTENFILEFI